MADAVGWCHHCETFQLRSAAVDVQPFAHVPAYFGVDRLHVAPGCVTPGCGETWEFGIFVIEEDPCARYHAERRDSLYPGDCGAGCPGRG